MARRFVLIAALAACTMALVPAVPAGAATTRAPKVTKVSPLIVAIGRTLHIRGRSFTPGTGRNTVIFQRSGGRAVFVRAGRSTRTKLAVTIPTRLRALLERDEQGIEQPTRFRLRIVSRSSRRSGRPTPVRLSPQIGPAAGAVPPAEAGGDCDRDGTPNGTDNDDDNDLLADSLELNSGLDSCQADTDGDQMEDAFEYWAAKDLNHKAVPYPGKKPYPNPLDATDAGIDFDGDTLTSLEEHNLWQRTGKAFDAARTSTRDLSSPLSYSDGTQTSRPDETPTVPAFRSGDYGIAFTPPAYPDAYVIRNDGLWSDDERDADADGLGNYLETHGLATQAWWKAKFAEEKIEPWPEHYEVDEETGERELKGNYYGEFPQRPFADPVYTDPDSDGDTLLDAEDDQDADDWANIYEMGWDYEEGKPATVQSRGDDGQPATRHVNPFNPCAPDGVSRTCPPYRPLGG